jgi:ABC-type Fe3+ transport system permease subunit
VALGLTYFTFISRSYHLLGVTISLRFLYGSLLLAVLVSLVNHLPFAVQAQLNPLMQLDLSLEEAAYVCRASFWQALVRVYLPLLRHGVVTTWLLLFIFVFKEIDTLAFVYAPLAFSTTDLGLQHLTRAAPLMYHVFGLINSAEQPELYAQGTGLLLLTCLILLGTTLIVARAGWQPFKEQLRR